MGQLQSGFQLTLTLHSGQTVSKKQYVSKTSNDYTVLLATGITMPESAYKLTHKEINNAYNGYKKPSNQEVKNKNVIQNINYLVRELEREFQSADKKNNNQTQVNNQLGYEFADYINNEQEDIYGSYISRARDKSYGDFVQN